MVTRDPAIEAELGRQMPEGGFAHDAALIRRDHYPVAGVNRQRCCVRCFDRDGKPEIWPCNPAVHAFSMKELIDE